MALSYACQITQANLNVIASEKPDFNRDDAIRWITDHESTGYFIRDEGSPFDCQFMAEVVFHEIYMFDSLDTNQLFRKIRSKR